MGVPAAFAAVPFLAGCACALLLASNADGHLPAIAAGAALLALVSAIASAAQDDGPGACAAVVAGCSLAGVALGLSADRAARQPPLLAWHVAHGRAEPVTIEGVLKEDATATAYGVSLALDVDRVESAETIGGARLSI